MRWPQENHQHGARRFVRRFALFPTRMDDGTLVWLEKYWEKQCWMQRTRYNEIAQSYITSGGEWLFEHRTLEREKDNVTTG